MPVHPYLSRILQHRHPEASNPFALAQIQREGADGVIREALAAELGRPLRESDLIIEVKQVQSDGPDDSIFDEIDQLNAEKQ